MQGHTVLKWVALASIPWLKGTRIRIKPQGHKEQATSSEACRAPGSPPNHTDHLLSFFVTTRTTYQRAAFGDKSTGLIILVLYKATTFKKKKSQ